jgi:Fur family peroxide stress response transcriptional regulator
VAKEKPDVLKISDIGSVPGLADFRMTPQRRQVYEVLQSRRDHPSASDVYHQVKDVMPTISLATVYNCLEAMTRSGAVKQVNLDREPSRYCANQTDHAHFYCQSCGQVSDVGLNETEHLSNALDLPTGTDVTRLEINVRGTCAACVPAATPLS